MGTELRSVLVRKRLLLCLMACLLLAPSSGGAMGFASRPVDEEALTAFLNETVMAYMVTTLDLTHEDLVLCTYQINHRISGATGEQYWLDAHITTYDSTADRESGHLQDGAASLLVGIERINADAFALRYLKDVTADMSGFTPSGFAIEVASTPQSPAHKQAVLALDRIISERVNTLDTLNAWALLPFDDSLPDGTWIALHEALPNWPRREGLWYAELPNTDMLRWQVTIGGNKTMEDVIMVEARTLSGTLYYDAVLQIKEGVIHYLKGAPLGVG